MRSLSLAYTSVQSTENENTCALKVKVDAKANTSIQVEGGARKRLCWKTSQYLILSFGASAYFLVACACHVKREASWKFFFWIAAFDASSAHNLLCTDLYLFSVLFCAWLSL